MASFWTAVIASLSALGPLGVLLILVVNIFMAYCMRGTLKVLWQIKTNDLPHIEARMAAVETLLTTHDKWERDWRKNGGRKYE